MDADEYADWIDELVAEGVYDPAMGEDFKRQRALFDERFRRRIEEGVNVPGALGFVANEPIVAASARALVEDASARYPDRAIYFESTSIDGV